MALSVEPEQIVVGADDLRAWEHSLREVLALGKLRDLREMLSALTEWLSATYQNAPRVGRRHVGPDNVDLWYAINLYVEACGGDPSRTVTNRRVEAVQAVNRLIAAKIRLA